MRIILDTHAFFWWATRHDRLSPLARAAIAERSNEVLVSAITAWELARKCRLGRWPEAAPVANGMRAILTDSGFVDLPVSLEHAQVAALLDSDHRDPFDRMLAAQAKVEGLPLVTADRAFRTFHIDVIW